MIKPTNPFQVPEDVRSMIEQGVSQAREGFGKVLGAASEATATLETKSDPQPLSAAELLARGWPMTETSVNAAFDFAQKMVTAKSLEEVFKLQTEFHDCAFPDLPGADARGWRGHAEKGSGHGQRDHGRGRQGAAGQDRGRRRVEAVRKASKPKKG